MWDHGILKKKNIDVNRFMDLHYGESRAWRAMIVSEHGALLVDNNSSMKKPTACFPVWKFGESFDVLNDLVQNPVGLNPRRIRRPEYMPPEFRYQDGQPHYVVVSYLPDVSTVQGRDFFLYLAHLQEENPECRIHIHGLYSWRVMFGLGFGSADVDARTDAAKKRLVLPNGRFIYVTDEEIYAYEHWVNLLGYDLKDLIESPRDRCMYNIKSALWASEHFRESVRFKNKGFEGIDLDTLSGRMEKTESKRIFVRQVKPLPDDKFFCNHCSLQSSCKFFRVGAVCAVPDSEPTKLAQFFKSRDSETILDGMTVLLQMEAERVQDARQAEAEKEVINPEVTKMLGQIFSHAEKFAKLLDPSLRAPAGPSITNNSLILNAGTPQELAAQAVNILVARGIPRSEITPEMIMELVESNQGSSFKDHAIEAGAVVRADP